MFNLNDYLSDLEKVVNIDSNSFYPEGLIKIADEFEKIAKKFGLYVKRHHLSDESGDLLEITNKKDSERYDVLMMGHMDTVQPVGEAAKRPYYRDENFAYGPGISDMKSGTLTTLYIYNELSDEAKEKLSICILMNPDEEILSKYSRKYTYEIAKKTDYGFVMEATSKKDTHTVQRKGSATYKITFHGYPGHAGYIFDNYTANAVVEMSRWAKELHEFNNREKLLSVNIAKVEGGTASNVVPDYACLTLNIRVKDKADYEEFENKLKELAETPYIEGVTTEVEIVSKNNPMIPAPGMDEYIERAKKVFASMGKELKLYPIRGGASDGNIIADAGTKCMDNLGPVSSGGHTHNEILNLDSVEPCIMDMKALIEEIASNK